MAHFRCLACRARVWRDGDAADHLRDLCPGCGGPVEPVGDLAELVGLRALRTRPRTAHGAYPSAQRIAEQVRDTIARHDAERQLRIDAQHRDGER